MSKKLPLMINFIKISAQNVNNQNTKKLKVVFTIIFNMKTKINLYFIFLSVLLYSCSNEFNDNLDVKQIVDNQQKGYAVSLQNALDELNNTLSIIDGQSNGNKSKGVLKKNREISKISVIYSGSYDTNLHLQKSGIRKVLAQRDSLLYIVDFADNGGSAVLAADSRISEPVLAITEEGNISDNTYPLYEAGVNYGDECLQGFNLFNQQENDYYVSQVAPAVLQYCYDYAEDCISSGGSSGGGTNNTIVNTVTSTWTLNEKINPKLTTVWHQNSPFNDAIPMSRWFFWQSYKRGPAGCVAIAVAQIMAYHEYPQNLTCNGYLINWTGIKSICNTSNRFANGTTYDRGAVAQLVSNIGGWCSMIYTPSWAFALPRKARDCMSTFGYQNVVRDYGYSETKVTDMLRNNNPVFIAAISGVFGGHAWVIDGYIDRSRTKKGYNSIGTLIKTDTETQHLMHCNFGWQGECNGYYVSGIFNTKNGSTEREGYENNWGSTSNSNFNWAFHIITYNNPKK